MIGVMIAALGAFPASAQQSTDQLPPELEGVGIDQKLDASIPLDLEFVDQNGKTVTLGTYFKQGKPVILTPVFYECPMLCSLILNGLVDGLKGLENLDVGDEFQIVTFSFDPEETPKLAEVKRRAYLSLYRRESAKQGWPFLTGSEADIRALTDALGFRYKYDEKQETFAHSASIMFITPEGRISRYMNDVMFEPRDLRLALIEAAEGKIGSPIERFLLFTCFTYDPDSNSYVGSAWKVMRRGGALIILALIGGVFWLAMRGPKLDQKKETTVLGGLKS